MGKRMDTVLIPMPMGTNTLVNSGITKGMDKAPKFLVLKVNGQGTITLVNSRMTNGMDKVPIPLLMAGRTLVNSRMES